MAAGWGCAGLLLPFGNTLASYVARNRSKRAQVVAFQTRGILGLCLPPEPPPGPPPGPPLCALLRASRSGVGLLGAPASILLLLAALVSPHRTSGTTR